MHYYKTTLRLAGNTMNEVVKTVSVPELLILQFIHGVDSLTRVTLVDEKREDLYKLKQWLKERYDQALVKREQSVDNIFGALGVLPEVLPNELQQRFGLVEGDSSDEDLWDEDIDQSMIEAKNEQTIVPAEKVSVADLVG